ncbi:MAG: hypothetical protein AB8B77_03695, partial [Alphaproteobacteria bacterium]
MAKHPSKHSKAVSATSKLNQIMPQAGDTQSLDWLQQLADEAGMNAHNLAEIGDSWALLEQLEVILRRFTKLYRETGHVDPLSYEDFADRLQMIIDALRENLGYDDLESNIIDP